jgi:carboxyl-terminal processing protease
VDDEALMRGAIQGMLDSLGDDHTAYMDPVTQEAIDTQLQGQYEGIGAIVDTTVDYLTIVSTYPDTPAEKAGLEPGDQIIAVDGNDMTEVDPELVRRKVIGPAGTEVDLPILREGTEKPFDVQVTRAKITLPNVDSKMLEGDIGYVLLYTFGDRTIRTCTMLSRDLMAQKPKGLILDLRNNGGGYLHVAIDVASEFIEDGVVVYEQYGDGTRETFEAKGNGLATEIPLVVLVNAGSASASEIVAGAIQDYDRAELVGETSFGKGSVQIVTDLVDNQGAVRVTIARWLTPKERMIHDVGLEPDVKVELTDEDIKADRDPQLDKAVEILGN